MARMALTTGACPVCDRDVPRTVSFGTQKETFCCPVHGKLAYTPHSHPLSNLAAPLVTALTGLAQPTTGLELVH